MTAPRNRSSSDSPDRDAAPEVEPVPAPMSAPAVRRPMGVAQWGSRGTAAVLGIGALVMLLLGATVGLALASRNAKPASISADGQDPVNTGFARDMVVHHNQGVLMAHIAELDSTDKEVQQMAYDIEFQQTSQIGTMQGWLDLWGVPRITDDPHMAWMGSVGMQDMNMVAGAGAGAGAGAARTGAGAGAAGTGGTAGAASGLSDGAVMPGMATKTELARLEGLKGRASDILFLQLMIRHHQGGAAMMNYAANHAASAVVQNFASKMVEAQTSEIGIMTGMLTSRGATPLPFTAPTG